ncbi:hypothetical protein AK812_SmicGene38854 [Symbiodinium microadriaticum]|uniref:Uncharacterized protein n=1 Tax=Symbiodinium microadriaticum TaxID=2951 RepID=A0A1Q9CCY4_SYMMI|nr:hypothetical protein AK812_SmicGene38854 [Symbiodinium microadriaticum]
MHSTGHRPVHCIFRCDNAAAESSSWKGLSMASGLCSVLRSFFLLQQRCRISVHIDHVPGIVNDVADALSRSKDPVALGFKQQEEVHIDWLSFCDWPQLSPFPDPSHFEGFLASGSRLDTDDADGGETWRGISKRASTTPLFTDTGISVRASMLSRSPDHHHRSIPTPRTEEMLALQRAGQRILQTLEDRKGSAAKWSPKSWKTPLEQGEDMLQEQLALDERERIVRLVKSKSNPSDPFRGHIAQNIKQRLEMANNDSTEGLAINQRCLNIRKQLAGMVNARKELASLRAKAHLLMEEPLLPRLILDSYGLYSELTD